MAGALVYGVAQHDVSTQMALLSLLPALCARLDRLIVVDGTSFRHKIAVGTERTAPFFAEVLTVHPVGEYCPPATLPEPDDGAFDMVRANRAGEDPKAAQLRYRVF